MDYFRPASERGSADFGWLNSKHSFSFGTYYDPLHKGVSVLRVLNDDTVAPGAGFDAHSHRDMEIISYVLEGAIEHRDSLGNEFVIPAGEVQRMSAGSGIAHSEYNPSADRPLRFLQIWLQPAVRGIEPEYQQAPIPQSEPLTPLVTPDGRGHSLSLHQDASLYRLRLARDETLTLSAVDRIGYLHVITGSASINGQPLHSGDGLGVSDGRPLHVHALEAAFEALWFDLPPTHTAS